ncbi:MAG TPA: transposase [Candidatus Binataceae bacterium]|nr:transposase [Candidatus Binataceae bacterium]
MSDDNEIRRGRHCVFKMHVHLVFVAKYRRRVFDRNAIDRLRNIFANVCADCGGAPISIVRQYIEQQHTPH